MAEISEIVKLLREAGDMTSTSLPRFTKPATINSRCLVSADVIEQHIFADVVSNIYSLYTGYVLLAMQMNTYLTDDRKVRDSLGVVSTEYLDLVSDMYSCDNVGKLFAATENIVKDYLDNDDIFDRKKHSAGSGDIRELLKEKFIANRSLEVELLAGDKKVKAFLMIQLSPRVLDDSVAEALVTLNFKDSISRRFLKFRVGELKFWKDFVFQMDIRNKRRKALKKDKDNVLEDALDRQSDSFFNNLLKIVRLKPESQNLANTILILDKNKFKRYCSNAGMNFKRYRDRQRFFQSSYAMMLVLVDSNYDNVDFYFNGIEGVSSYTFNMLKNSKQRENASLVEIMAAMNKNTNPPLYA